MNAGRKLPPPSSIEEDIPHAERAIEERNVTADGSQYSMVRYVYSIMYKHIMLYNIFIIPVFNVYFSLPTCDDVIFCVMCIEVNELLRCYYILGYWIVEGTAVLKLIFSFNNQYR